MPRRKPPWDETCDGIGWGCTPNQHDGAIIVAMAVGTPLLLVSLLLSGVGLAVVLRRTRSGVLAGTVAVAASWLAISVAGCAGLGLTRS